MVGPKSVHTNEVCDIWCKSGVSEECICRMYEGFCPLIDWFFRYCEVFCENVTLFAYQWHNTSVRQVMFVWTFCLSFIVRGIRKLRVQGALFVTRGLKNTLDPLSNILNYVHSLLCCLTNRKKKNTFSGCTSCSFLWLLGQPSFDIYSMSKSFPRRGPSSL